MKQATFWILIAAWVIGPPERTVRAQHDDVVRTKSFGAVRGGALEVSLGSGDVLIRSWGKDEVFVTARAADAKDIDDLEMSSTGGTVRIRSTSDWSDDVRLYINVPSEFDLNLQTSAGDIDIEGPLHGDIVGKTSAGDIRLGDVTGRIDMQTSGGDVHAAQIEGDATLHTSGGDIKVGAVKGDADLETAGGDITVESVLKNLIAKTSGGDIDVGDIGGEATLSTAGGDLRVGKVSGSAKLSSAGGDIQLNGASGRVKVGTAGGNIQLSMITGSIEAKTAGGDLRAELIPSGTGRSTLSTAAGEVKLFISPDAKATISAVIRIERRARVKWAKKYAIHSDFSSDTYDVSHDNREIRATYKLNGGGEPITLETTNADIEIRKFVPKSR